MRIFLLVLMVLIVSGDDETIDIKADLHGSVLLPCNCAERSLDEEFLWQMDAPSKRLVFKYTRTTSDFTDKYKGRAKIFLSENSNNCSFLLTNITAEDQGTYRCSFYQATYQKLLVNLSIYVSYNVCQKAHNLSGSEKVFQCEVDGCYGEASIQWKNLAGQLLTNSSTTNITNRYRVDAFTGVYHFYSNLSTKDIWTAEPRCDVKAKYISATINSDCRTNASVRGGSNSRHRYFKVIPIVLVLLLSLLLRCC